jgi:hypothetical protein
MPNAVQTSTILMCGWLVFSDRKLSWSNTWRVQHAQVRRYLEANGPARLRERAALAGQVVAAKRICQCGHGILSEEALHMGVDMRFGRQE